jgi:hypothetical protein
MKRMILGTVLLASAMTASAQNAGKKELVQKLLALQQPGVEQLSRNIVERPAAQMMQEVGLVLQRQIAPDKRESVAKQVETEVKKYVDESVPLVRERAIKLAPSVFGPMLEEKFSEDELKQLIAWFESPVNKKFQQVGPEMQNTFVQKLLADARPVVDPKLQALDARVRVILGAPPAAPPASGATGAMSTPRPPATAASKSK